MNIFVGAESAAVVALRPEELADLHTLAMAYIRGPESVAYQANPYALAFATKLAHRIRQEVDMDEVAGYRRSL